MNNEVKYTYKEVTLRAGITEKSRKKILDKKIQQMAKEGWELESHFDGGVTKPSKVTFKRDINYQVPKKQSKGAIKKIFKYILYTFLGLILLAILGSMLPKPELTPEQKEKIAIEKQRQIKATKEYVNKILNVIFSDIVRNEKHLQDFSKTLSSNNVIKILEQSKQYNYYARKWSMKKYIKAKEWGAKKDELVNEIISKASDLATFHQIYYNSIDEYIDNQVPSKLLDIKHNLETINNYKNDILIKAMTLASKYNLTYNEKKNIWEESKKNTPIKK